MREMATTGSGAVFFLGTRAHYQVLQQPETKFDVENGNASTETIYRNPSVQWPGEQKLDVDNTERWYCDDNNDDKGSSENILRSRRRPSETTLCEKEDIKPALLNNIGNNNPKCGNCNRNSLLTLLWSLARRKKRLASDEPQYLQHINDVLNNCTYRESCRCLECQSRYFECDEDSDDYSSDDSYSGQYTQYVEYVQPQTHVVETVPEPEEDDEVFIDTVPEDNTSTDLLLEEKKMSTSSEEQDPEDKLQLEVAAGTPVLLNYLLTHPITCAIM